MLSPDFPFSHAVTTSPMARNVDKNVLTPTDQKVGIFQLIGCRKDLLSDQGSQN
jgi:hypothetical protein